MLQTASSVRGSGRRMRAGARLLLAGENTFEDGLGIIHYCRLGDLLRAVCGEGDRARSRATTSSTIVRTMPGVNQSSTGKPEHTHTHIYVYIYIYTHTFIYSRLRPSRALGTRRFGAGVQRRLKTRTKGGGLPGLSELLSEGQLLYQSIYLDGEG